MQSSADVIKIRGYSFPIARAATGPHQDVEGVVVDAPQAFSAEMSKHFRGRILMVSDIGFFVWFKREPMLLLCFGG